MKSFIFKCALAISTLTVSLVSANGFCDSFCCDPCADWGKLNFYVGGNLGVVSETAHLNDFDGFLTDNSGWSRINTSFTGGGQIGLDWQRCNSLFGIVADWNRTGTTNKLRDNPNNSALDQFMKDDFDWIATIRARAGLTVGNALVYITGGAARAKFQNTWHEDTVNFKHNNSRWGWTGGAGAEFKVWCNFSIATEVLFAHFANKDRTFTDPTDPATRYSFGHSNSVWLGKVMLNYSFGDFSRFFCK